MQSHHYYIYNIFNRIGSDHFIRKLKEKAKTTNMKILVFKSDLTKIKSISNLVFFHYVAEHRQTLKEENGKRLLTFLNFKIWVLHRKEENVESYD